MAIQQFSRSAGRSGVTSPAHSSDSPLLQLPTDVFLLIVEQLPLHARYFLSQTCPSIREIVGQDWEEILNGIFISSDEGMEFFAGLAYFFPDRFICLRCRELHRVDVEDVPSRGYTGLPAECPLPNSNRYDRWISYSLGYHHVQLAPKYTRLNGPYAEYLARLMAPVTVKRRGSLTPIAESCRKVPGIRAGRFILETVIEYVEMPIDKAGLSWHMVKSDLGVAMLCRHNDVKRVLGKLRADEDLKPGEFMRHLDSLAIENTERRQSCRRCRTDMLFHFQRGVWTFQSWQDFGSEAEVGIGLRDIIWT